MVSRSVPGRTIPELSFMPEIEEVARFLSQTCRGHPLAGENPARPPSQGRDYGLVRSTSSKSFDSAHFVARPAKRLYEVWKRGPATLGRERESPRGSMNIPSSRMYSRPRVFASGRPWFFAGIASHRFGSSPRGRVWTKCRTSCGIISRNSPTGGLEMGKTFRR